MDILQGMGGLDESNVCADTRPCEPLEIDFN